MQVRNFEDLEIWKDARALTREIYQLTRDSNSQKILPCGIKSDVQQSRSCQTSRRGLNEEAIKNSFSFSMSPKHPVGKFALNFT